VSAAHNIESDLLATRLSEIDRRILRLVAEGLTSKEIARELDRSPLTIDSRLKDVCHRLGADTRAQAAAMLSREEAAATTPELGGSPGGGVEPRHRRPPHAREDGGPQDGLIRPSSRFATVLSDPRLNQAALKVLLVLVAVATAAYLLASAIEAIQEVFLTVLRG